MKKTIQNLAWWCSLMVAGIAGTASAAAPIHVWEKQEVTL